MTKKNIATLALYAITAGTQGPFIAFKMNYNLIKDIHKLIVETATAEEPKPTDEIDVNATEKEWDF